MRNVTLLCLCIVAATTGAAQTKSIKYIDPANIDKSVKPGDDFYQYANGNWMKNNKVPPSETRWGSFNILREESSRRLKSLLEEAAANTATDRKTQVVGDFYMSGMDSVKIENLGYRPIAGQLQEISALTDKQGLLNTVARIRTMGLGNAFFGTSISPDRKNVQQYIPNISQGGTSLPDRDYYLKDDARSTRIRDAFKKQVQQMFVLAGHELTAANNAAATVLKVETILAQKQLSRVEMRDPYRLYNKFAVKDLSTLTPSMNWQNLLQEMKINGADSVLVNNPAFLKSVDSLIANLPLEDLKTYVKWNVIRSAAPYLSKGFVNADFALSSVMTGQKVPTPRWQRMSSLIDRTLGDFIGELYVAKYFKPEAKARMIELVKNLEVTFAERIRRLDWMSDVTKEKALQKLNAFAKKIAYPDKWKTYDGVTVSRDTYFENIKSVNSWAYNYNVKKMGKKVDRTEMGMTPPTINASYSATNNDITFPAGILQFPFFDFGADDAVNYGGIGSVIGHEIIHGFDDQGRQSDAFGNLKDWWAPADGEKFKAKADEVVQQYNGYTVLDTIHVNGKLTLGENLADLGGLSIAYEAFTKTKQFKENKKIDGFTPSQRFFLSWAQIWRNNILPESAAQLILTDTHSPGSARGNGPVVNIDAWYDAFNVKPGNKMYKSPETRTRIW